MNVHYDGPGKLQFSVDFGPWKEVPVDPTTGKGKITAPAGSRHIVFADLDEKNPSSVIIEVLSTGKP